MATKEQLEDDDDVKDDDVEIVVKEPEGETVDAPDEDDDKPKKKAEPRDEGDEDEEDEPQIKLSPEEIEAVKERRRKEKAARKERREKAIARDKVEMKFLRERNEELERRMMAQEMRSSRQDHYTVEQQIAEQENRARTAEQVLAKAIAEANGDDAAAALKYRDEALEKIRTLANDRDKLTKEKEDLERAPVQKPLDPIISNFAQEWIANNPWYDPDGRDLDSRFVLLIDQGLVDEGYAPRTAQYWKELDKRVRARLPHKYESDGLDDEDESDATKGRGAKPRGANQRQADSDDDDDDRPSRQPKKGPPIGQPRESNGAQAKKREIYISPERKEALIQAGVWDDPVLRMKYVKRYQNWDKDNAAR